jgi:hypothetical protein
MSDAEILQQCQNWISRGSDDPPAFFEDYDIKFSDCRNAVQQAQGGAGRSVSANSRFFTWGTFIVLVLAVALPYLVVGIYTDFRFQWKGGEEQK